MGYINDGLFARKMFQQAEAYGQCQSSGSGAAKKKLRDLIDEVLCEYELMNHPCIAWLKIWKI